MIRNSGLLWTMTVHFVLLLEALLFRGIVDRLESEPTQSVAEIHSIQSGSVKSLAKHNIPVTFF